MSIRNALILLCLLLSVQLIFSKGNDDRGGNKDNRDHDNNGYSRQERERDKNRDKDINKNSKKNTKQEKINSSLKQCIDITVETQLNTKDLSKSIKKDNQADIIDRFNKVKENLGKIDSYKIDLLKLFDDEEKNEIKDQIRIIEDSQNRSKIIIEQIGNELSNNIESNEKLLSRNNELEKEVNKIERQFRAIEWILTEN